MNRSILTSSAVLLSMLASQVYADDICKQKGSLLSCKAGSVEQIINTGGVRLKGTEVLGKVMVTGSFKAQNAKLNEVKVTGSTELDESVINQDLEITGSTKSNDSNYLGAAHITGKFSSLNDTFEASVEVTGQVSSESSHFKSPLKVTAREINLSSVDATDVIIQKSSSTNSKQSLYLRENTQINGNITFEGGNGMVFMSGGSQVTGEILGAEVYQGQ